MPDVLGMNRGRFLAMIAMALAVTSTARADFAYIGYYHSETVDKLNINSNGSIASGATFGAASGYAPESIMALTNMPGPNASQIYVVDATDGSVKSYTTSGTLISNNILETSSGATMNLGPGGAAGATLDSTGQYLYVTYSSPGSTSGVYQFNAVTGKEIGFLPFEYAHDVAFHDGKLYVTAYQASQSNSLAPNNTGVWQFNSDLSGGNKLITPSNTNGAMPNGTGGNDLYNATGMAFIGNNLYVANSPVNGGVSAQSFVQQYTLSNSDSKATYVTTFSSPTNIVNPFGMTAGPDGNIYISSLGILPDANGNTTNPGQITELYTSGMNAGTTSAWLTSGNDGAGQAPKYLMYESQATVFVPEPASVVLMGLGLAGVAVIGRSRRRKTASAA